jgi:hypothetical protein
MPYLCFGDHDLGAWRVDPDAYGQCPSCQLDGTQVKAELLAQAASAHGKEVPNQLLL